MALSKFKDWLMFDVWYVDSWSLLLNVRILALTIPRVLGRIDVSITQQESDIGFPFPGEDDRRPRVTGDIQTRQKR